MDQKGIIATIVGVIALVVFGVFAYYLARHISDGQQQWDRLVYIFGGVEAVAFAAAGFFFGKEVNRARAESADERAKQAETTAKQDHAEKSEAKTKLSLLVKQVVAEGSRSLTAVDDVEEIHTIARQAGITEKDSAFTALVAAIQAKRARTKDASDQRWASLVDFANSLQ